MSGSGLCCVLLLGRDFYVCFVLGITFRDFTLSYFHTSLFNFKTGSRKTAQVGIEFVNCSLQPFKCWSYRCALLPGFGGSFKKQNMRHLVLLEGDSYNLFLVNCQQPGPYNHLSWICNVTEAYTCVRFCPCALCYHAVDEPWEKETFTENKREWPEKVRDTRVANTSL